MSNILFATDLGDAGEKAFTFLLPLADALRAKIWLLHVEHIPATEIQASGGMLEEVMQHRHKAALEGLYQLKMEIAEFAFRNNTIIESDHILSSGLIAEEIMHAANQIKPDFIVVGAGMHKGFPSFLSGDIATVLIKKLHTTLLIVPQTEQLPVKGKLVFATGWDKGDDAILQQLASYARQLQKELVILHVDQHQSDNTIQLQQHLGQHYTSEWETGRISLVIDEQNDIADGITEYVKSNEVLILAVGHHHHRFELFHKNIAEGLATEVNVPLMVFQH